jgi:nitrite reductase/ring-hydroxylating ferredoxin subunit
MWVEAGDLRSVERARKLVVTGDGRPIAVFAHAGRIYALDDTCIHKQRELSKGVILNNRVVCPGHQWAYELETGYCRERDRCQPTHAVKVEGDIVWVDTAIANDAQPAPFHEAEQPDDVTVEHPSQGHDR